MSRPVCVQRTGRRKETSYKAESLGKAAQHVKALGSGDPGDLREPPVRLPAGSQAFKVHNLGDYTFLKWPCFLS